MHTGLLTLSRKEKYCKAHLITVQGALLLKMPNSINVWEKSLPIEAEAVPHFGEGNGFSDQGCGRTFGDGMITVGTAGGFFPYHFCKSRMCPAVIGIVPDLHTKPRPKAFIEDQVGHHTFLPWMLY